MSGRFLSSLIEFYRRWLSPLAGRRCRYEPTCSRYAQEALALYGVRQGSWLALKRIARCHPWSSGGIDRVPQERGA